ncbi:MAG: PTS sugar transporter subunit IIC [Solobacterium sp.]|nr:PTS sugar transporter subunit IIC [Solobacterium sp.]
MNIAIFILIFLLAIDQFALTQIFHRPIVLCSLLGLIYGDISTGMMLGVYLETLVISLEETYFMNYRTSTILTSVILSVLVLGQNMTMDSVAVLASACFFLGTGLMHILDSFYTLFLPLSRTAAEKGKGITLYHFLPMILTGLVFGIVSQIVLAQGDALTTFVSNLANANRWLFTSFAIFASLLPCLGIAVLLRNLKVKEVSGLLFLGIAAAALTYLMNKSVSMMLLVGGLVAVGVATILYSFEKGSVAGTKEKGVSGKWW